MRYFSTEGRSTNSLTMNDQKEKKGKKRKKEKKEKKGSDFVLPEMLMHFPQLFITGLWIPNPVNHRTL